MIGHMIGHMIVETLLYYCMVFTSQDKAAWGNFCCVLGITLWKFMTFPFATPIQLWLEKKLGNSPCVVCTVSEIWATETFDSFIKVTYILVAYLDNLPPAQTLSLWAQLATHSHQ